MYTLFIILLYLSNIVIGLNDHGHSKNIYEKCKYFNYT